MNSIINGTLCAGMATEKTMWKEDERRQRRYEGKHNEMDMEITELRRNERREGKEWEKIEMNKNGQRDRQTDRKEDGKKQERLY